MSVSRVALNKLRREKGLCIWCDSPLSSKSRSLCDKHRAELNERNKKSRKKLRHEVLNAYGGLCECCGESHVEFLGVDHIDGGGRKHLAELGGSAYFYGWLKKNGFPPGYRILCHNCNFSIGKYGYCPHKIK